MHSRGANTPTLMRNWKTLGAAHATGHIRQHKYRARPARHGVTCVAQANESTQSIHGLASASHVVWATAHADSLQFDCTLGKPWRETIFERVVEYEGTPIQVWGME